MIKGRIRIGCRLAQQRIPNILQPLARFILQVATASNKERLSDFPVTAVRKATVRSGRGVPVAFWNQPQGASPRFLEEPDASAWRLMRHLFLERSLAESETAKTLDCFTVDAREVHDAIVAVSRVH